MPHRFFTKTSQYVLFYLQIHLRSIHFSPLPLLQSELTLPLFLDGLLSSLLTGLSIVSPENLQCICHMSAKVMKEKRSCYFPAKNPSITCTWNTIQALRLDHLLSHPTLHPVCSVWPPKLSSNPSVVWDFVSIFLLLSQIPLDVISPSSLEKIYYKMVTSNTYVFPLKKYLNSWLFLSNSHSVHWWEIISPFPVSQQIQQMLLLLLIFPVSYNSY